ncbi:hypothetical protein SZN_09396 [Streptomyces zinciresistens K42]|uniref:Uncharacterized protein n=1 Tax=Streptomyces zinciresistens K42 TaxID=700597 RepID=G2G8R1_9ACTN|nr:hypothetical protein [Streptomyces zinciresistens]EGX60126.1 hypothetical protein SZN_09396 [Streptomyces zinciresistens K42]
MSLNWRTAEVELAEQLVPNPNAEHQLLQRLHNVRVAIEAGFLHIDPRTKDYVPPPGQDTYTVTVVPAHLVRRVTYQAETPKKAETVEVRVG